MCSDATNGEDLKTKSEAQCLQEGEGMLSDSRSHPLGDVLEMLIRLDQHSHFMNASDTSLALDYPPMCFSKMQEKVSTEQYPTWNSFVDDFESICHNAMKHNPKRSEVWNAAHLLLRQGSRCLEQQLSKERIEYNKSIQNGVDAQGDKSSPRVKLEQNEGPLPESAVGLFVHASQEERASNKAVVKLEIDDKGEEGHNLSVDKAISPNSQLFLEKNLKEAMMVDVLGLSPVDLARLESDKQATDCSSSFGDTQVSLTDDEVDGQSCEVESQHRNGNGAMVLSDDIPPNRKKKAVNLEWKTYRQGIEWRCRWLELRVKELWALANKYNKMLVTAKSTMKQESEQQESMSARTSAIFNGSQHRALLRLRRRKEEENADSKMHMSKHPLFSRYEKKQQRSQEELANEENNKDDSYQILDFDDFHPDFDYGFGDDFLVEEDSIEQYLWHIETLQLHVCRLKNQLSKGSMTHRNAVGQVKDIICPGGVSQVSLYDPNTLTSSPNHLGARSLLGGFKAKGGKSLSRKRIADFDTDSLIMPDTVMANYIEPAWHAFIETPHWRVLGDASVSARGASSSEDSDDETYRKRNIELQLQEIHEQDAPGNKGESLASVKEQTCVERESTVNTTDGALNENVQNFSTSFGFVPRRKRRRRESRGNASVAKNIEPLLKASYEDSTDLCEGGGLVEDEDIRKTGNSSTG